MLEWVTSSCFLILAVLALRAVLGRKISARFRYGLWVLVLVRLLVPVQLYTSPMAGMSIAVSPALSEKLEERSLYVLPVGSVPVKESDVQIEEDGKMIDPDSFGYPKLSGDGRKIVQYADKISPLQALKILWLFGFLVSATILLASNLRFAARLRRVRKPMGDIPCRIPVYLAEHLPSPCLFGVLRPAIYVTEPATENPVMLRHILAHELTHYKHFDHIWSVLRGITLALHWWNPLVWLAVVCSRRDGELACDEGALKSLDREERTAYGETLLTLVTAKPGPQDLLCCATTMSGEKRSLRERIRRISCEPKQLVSAVIAVIMLLSAMALCAFGRWEREDTASESAWWRTAYISVDEAGVPCLHYTDSTGEHDRYGEPIPAPAEWAGQDLAGRNEAAALGNPPDGHLWAKLVSPDDGWLVACWGHGVGGADTYVYRTSDGGMTWTETTMPGLSWHTGAVGFLSPDRLIVAQELFEGAPVFLTKDGGDTWEEISIPETDSLMVAGDIYVYGNEVQIALFGDGSSTWTMVSEDLGDTWKLDENAALDRFLANMSVEDIGDVSYLKTVTASELVDLLHETAANRMSRFYDYNGTTYAGEESWVWSRAGWNLPLVDGSILHMEASARNAGVYIYWETAGSTPAAFYRSEELNELIYNNGNPYPREILSDNLDLDHNGKSETMWLVTSEDGSAFALNCTGGAGDGEWSWFQTAYRPHVGWNALFLCRVNGEDYLLQYNPYMGGGVCQYSYELFYLQDGREVVVQENQVDFDIIFNADYQEQHVFDPKAIAAFMDEVNALLADSTQLLNTDDGLLGTFEREGRLYDSLWWLDDTRDEDLTLLENLLVYRNEAIRDASAPDVRTVMAEWQEEDFNNLTEEMRPVMTEKFHWIAENMTAVSGGETFRSWYSIPCENDFPNSRFDFLLLAADEENVVCILYKGWQEVLFYSENPDDPDSFYLHRTPYTYVYRVEDAELYQFLTEKGLPIAEEEAWFREKVARDFEYAQKNTFVQ